MRQVQQDILFLLVLRNFGQVDRWHRRLNLVQTRALRKQVFQIVEGRRCLLSLLGDLRLVINVVAALFQSLFVCKQALFLGRYRWLYRFELLASLVVVADRVQIF